MVRKWWPESSAEGQRSRTLSYSEWAEALADQFFPPSTARRPVRFAVDDDILDEIAETQDGQGARSLAAAVRPQLRLAEPRRLYDDVLSNAYAWTSGPRDGAPPFLPCLAVCVLAAARMDSKQGISASNYYSRLREVLDVNVSASVGYPDAIPSLFRLLHEWLERTQRGRRGQSTIPDSPKYAHIGFALSQVSFRESDRRKLTRFFAQLGLKSRDSSAGPLLVGRMGEHIRSVFFSEILRRTRRIPRRACRSHLRGACRLGRDRERRARASRRNSATSSRCGTTTEMGNPGHATR